MATANPIAEQIIVRVLKHDGVESRRWKARVARREDPLIVLDAEFEVAVQHDLIGDIPSGTRTIEYYWLDRWYNVFQFLEVNNQTRLYYCNVNTPPVLRNGVLSYIDLDLDVLVAPDFSYQVLDSDEFAANTTRFGYSDETLRQAHKALAELTSMIERRQFPFMSDPST
jgi:protein associated with RNAse G/E